MKLLNWRENVLWILGCNIVFSVECIELPPGGEGWPGILKMKTCQQGRVQIVFFHTLLRLQLPLLSRIDTFRRPATQYFTQLEKLPIFGRNPRNFFTAPQQVDQNTVDWQSFWGIFVRVWTFIRAITGHNHYMLSLELLSAVFMFRLGDWAQCEL